MMESPKLPSKRSTTSTPATMPSSTKKSKAEFKRESAARAKAWAEERKRKNERLGGAEDGEETKHTKLSGDKRDEDSVEEERGDVLENLPSTPPTARASRRSARLPPGSDGHDDSSLMSESSRSSRALRRRTMDVAATSTAEIEPKNVASTPVGKRGGRARNSVGPGVSATSTTVSEGAKETMSVEKMEEKKATLLKPRRSRKSETPQKSRAVKTTPAKTKSAIAEMYRDEYVEREGNNKVAVLKETRHEDVRSENYGGLESAEQLAVEVQDNTVKTFKEILHSILPQVLVFTHALLLQWTIAFSIIVIFFPDWFIFQFCFDGACLGISNNGTRFMTDDDRARCATFGICLVIIAGNSIVHGSCSKIGWVSTTSSLAMASFSTRIDWWGISDRMILTVPSIPVYSKFNVPDLLVMIGLIGTVAALNQVGGDAGQTESEVEGSLPNAQSENAGLEDADDVEQSDFGNGEKAARKCIGLRIAVEKKGVVFLGTVTDYDHSDRLWCVEYDSTEQDKEFFNRIQLASAIKEHSKEWTNYLKAIWLDGSI